MTPRDAGRSFFPIGRGQTAVLGLVLLIGMVAIVSVGMLVVAGDTITSTEQETENERVEQGFIELSQQMAAANRNSDVSRSMDLDTGEKGAVVKTDTADINITGSNFSEPVNISIGAIEYQGDDGTRISYQAGGVFRETGDETRVVSAPPISYDNETSSFSFPIIGIADESQINSGDVSLSHNDTRTHSDLTHIENSIIEITITSEYCVGWENYFEHQTKESAILEECNENTDGRVIVELGLIDLENAYDQGLYVGGEGGIDLECKNHDTVAGPVTVQGELDQDTKDCLKDEDEATSIDSTETHPPIDRIIKAKVKKVKDEYEIGNVANFEDGITLQDGNTYYRDGDVTIADDTIAELSDGSISVVIDGDIEIVGGNKNNPVLEIKEYESSDASLNIYTTGNLTIDGAAATDDFDYNNPNAKHFNIYGKSSMIVGAGDGGGNIAFEGTILAPRHDAALNNSPNTAYPGYPNNKEDCKIDENGPYADVCLHGGNIEFGGAIIAGPVLIDGDQGSDVTLRWDNALKDQEPDLPTDEAVLPPGLTYFNIVEYKIDVEN